MLPTLCMFRGHRWERDPDDYGAYPLFHCTRCGKHKEFPMEKALEVPRGLRGVAQDAGQSLAAGVAIAAIGGLIGFLVVGQAAKGFGWGMIVPGCLVMFVVGGSGSPGENLLRGRLYRTGLPGWNSPTRSVPLPQTPFQFAIGGALAFGLGVAILFLFAY